MYFCSKYNKLYITCNLLVNIWRYTTIYFSIVKSFSVVIVDSNSFIIHFGKETGAKSANQ